MPFFLKKILFATAMSAALVAHSAAPAPAAAAAPAAQPARFSVVVEGRGPDVVLIPGLTSSRRVFDAAAASLGGHYRLHRLQIAGFGGEPARGNAQGEVLANVVEELHAYIQANRLAHPAIVGHSIGGLIALMLAERHPEDAGKLLIVDALPYYGALFGADATVATVAPRAAQLRDAIAAMSDDAWRQQQEAVMARLAMTESARPALLADSLASDRGVVARAMYEDLTTDARPGLAAIRAPLTVIYAVNPFATEAQYGSLVRAGYASAPGVRLVPVEPSYHFIMLDQAARFNDLLGAFLQGSGRANN
jgi:pimeloyl-ACP methyl ester carboxylesterase